MYVNLFFVTTPHRCLSRSLGVFFYFPCSLSLPFLIKFFFLSFYLSVTVGPSLTRRYTTLDGHDRPWLARRAQLPMSESPNRLQVMFMQWPIIASICCELSRIVATKAGSPPGRQPNLHQPGRAAQRVYPARDGFSAARPPAASDSGQGVETPSPANH